MAAIHDRAREERLVERGGRRKHFRFSAKAREMLERLAEAYDCSQRDVVEGLLLGTIDPRGAKTEGARKLLQFATRERLSSSEVSYLEPIA
jgi:hypothetical protein